jgi:hypothetical protein
MAHIESNSDLSLLSSYFSTYNLAPLGGMWVGLQREETGNPLNCSDPFFWSAEETQYSSIGCNASGYWCAGEPQTRGMLAAFTHANPTCLMDYGADW